MKHLTYVVSVLALVFVSGLQGCSNSKPQLEPGTMRIWLSPANRSNAGVDTAGYIYVKVND